MVNRRRAGSGQPFLFTLPDLDDEPEDREEEDREDEDPERPEEAERPAPDEPLDFGAL
jgi:hypothetical protein